MTDTRRPQRTPDELVAEAAHHYNAGPSGVDAMFEAFRQLGEKVSAQRAADRQAKKDARNARRRARYRTNPPARGPKSSAVIVNDDVDFEPGCRCQVSANPPCTWCTDGPAD